MASQDIDLEDVPPDAYVLRGGDFHGSSHLKNLRAVHEAYGVWGVCVACEPNKTPLEIASLGTYGGRTFMVARVDGVVGVSIVTAPHRRFSIAAWRDVATARSVVNGSAAHQVAMQAFFEPAGVGSAAYTSVWQPAHINPMWVRCDNCREVRDAGMGVTCACGATLRSSPSYW